MTGGTDKSWTELERHIGRRMWQIGPATHLTGALVVFAFLMLTSGPPPDEDAIGVMGDFVLFAVAISVTGVVVGWWQDRSCRRALHWLMDGRVPTTAEIEDTLAEPWRQALRPFVAWVANAGLWGVVNLAVHGDRWLHTIQVVDAILLGGLMACALSYLFLERAFRPVVAVALAHADDATPRLPALRRRLLVAWAVGSGVPLLGLALRPLGYEDGAAVSMGTSVTMLAVVGLLSGAAASFLAARSIAEPLDGVRLGLARVQAGDLDVALPVDDGGEVGLVQAGFNRMVDGLRERQRLRDLFGRHVGVEVARHALDSSTGLGGEQREASILFVDLAGSTAMTEVLQPEEVVATLNALFGAVVRVVAAEGGWVNKFEGDGAMCVFGAPDHNPDHAARALRAARKLHHELLDLAETHPGLHAGIGVSAGLVVAGNVGAEQRYEYTVVGAPVNEASRLTELAKARDVPVLASEAALSSAGDESRAWVSVGRVAIRGRSSPAHLFEPIAVADPAADPAEISSPTG